MNCSGAPVFQRASVAGTGIFKDQASDALLQQIFFAGAIRTWQIIVPSFGTIAGTLSGFRTRLARRIQLLK